MASRVWRRHDRENLSQIDQADVARLRDAQVHETTTLDYKIELKLQKGDDRKELARDIAAFANAAGGDLIIGVEEARGADGKSLGYPESFPGFDCPNFDDFKLSVEAVLKEYVTPRVSGVAFHRVDGFPKPVVIVRIPKSWNGPHMAAAPGQSYFYTRNSAGKLPLDVQQIRAAFLLSEHREEAIRRFRDERVGRVVAGELPIRLKHSEEARLIVLVVPVGDGSKLDLRALAESNQIHPFQHGSGWNNRFNLDGYLAYTSSTYTLAFRSGAFEGSSEIPIHLNKNESTRRVYPFWIETEVVKFVSRCLGILRSESVEAPVAVMLGACGLAGVRFTSRPEFEYPSDSEKTINRPVLVLPGNLDRGKSRKRRTGAQAAFRRPLASKRMGLQSGIR
ncbi:MAG: ATP-binding protein [Polyangiaceae bacterium]